MVEWLAGNRIRGTSTERTSATGFNPVTTSGGWKEVGRTTLGSAGTTIDVSSLPDKRYYQFLINTPKPVNSRPDARFNSDTGSNYSGRNSYNGAEATYVNATYLYDEWSGTDLDSFTVGYVSNLAGKEKLQHTNTVAKYLAGAGNAPRRNQAVGKWTNTSNSIDEFNIYSPNQNFDSGSEVVVLGWDPDDTHTTNFWEELASVDLSGGASNNIDSGTITAKKYLWIQIYAEVSTSCNGAFTFNSDTGSNYAIRVSANGGTDGTWGGLTNLNFQGTIDTKPVFQNAFIINNSANEKLMMGNNIDQGTAGAGNAPNRKEYAGKWANTSAQITSINYKSASANTFGTNSIMKVWGHD